MAIIGALLALQHFDMFLRFCRRFHPDTCTALYRTYAYPMTFFFFLKAENVVLLRKDPHLWKMRSQVVWLSILFAAAVVTAFGLRFQDVIIRSLPYLFAVFGIGGFAVTMLIWLLTCIQGGRLLRYMFERHPGASKKYLYPGVNHPENTFFFLRSSNIAFMKRDPRLWSMRQLFVRLALLSLAFPLAVSLVVALIVYTLAH